MEQGSSKKNNIIVLCVVIAVIAVALVAYFVISGQKDNGQPAVSATMELNTVNIYGAWYKKAGDSTYELRFKDNKELSYKQTAADGTVTAQSDEGTYDIADGKLILTIVAGGQTYSDTCIANVNEKQMSLVTEANGVGFSAVSTTRTERIIPYPIFQMMNRQKHLIPHRHRQQRSQQHRQHPKLQCRQHLHRKQHLLKHNQKLLPLPMEL